MRLVRSESVAAGCWRPLERYVLASTEALENQYRGGHRDALLSYYDIGNHSCGEYSMASVQANNLPEDQSELKLFPLGTFIGVYDGHGGPEAAHFIKDHLFAHLTKFASEQGGISVDVIRKAFDATEKGFESVVSKAWKSKPLIAAVGSCCLAGVICNKTLYVANLGDSRAVMGTALQNGGVAPRQLTTEHNAGIEAVREQLRFLHPDDSNIVSQRHGVWRVKGIIQVSRSIGDLYLKKQEFNREPLLRHFRLSEPIRRPVLMAEPSITVHKLALRDRFLIFASDGLWEHLSNEEAVNIVHSHPHRGVARRLIKAALRVAARKREMRYSDLKRVEAGVRRHLHDDISVVVLFFNHALSNPK